VLMRLLYATTEEALYSSLLSKEEVSKKEELTRLGLTLLLVLISIEASQLYSRAIPVSLLMLCLASIVSTLIS
jgi:hypothetical protein